MALPTQDIKVGHVIEVRRNDRIPADIVLLSSSHDEGISYIETTNLDGETNLKLRKSLQATQGLTEQQLGTLNAAVECELPNASLYTFTGNLHLVQPDGSDMCIPINP